MKKISIEFSDEMKALLDKEVEEGGFKSASEYFEYLVRREHERELAKAELEEEITKGLESGPAKPTTDGDWDRLHRQLEERISAQSR